MARSAPRYPSPLALTCSCTQESARSNGVAEICEAPARGVTAMINDDFLMREARSHLEEFRREVERNRLVRVAERARDQQRASTRVAIRRRYKETAMWPDLWGAEWWWGVLASLGLLGSVFGWVMRLG